MTEPPALVPVDDVKALLSLPSPNTHHHALPLPVRETLTAAESSLRKEVYKLLRAIGDQPALSEAYAALSLRLSSTLKDYLNLSGANEAQQDMANIKRARINVETFVEKQLRQRQLNGDEESALSYGKHAPASGPAVFDESTAAALDIEESLPEGDPPPPDEENSELDDFDFTL